MSNKLKLLYAGLIILAVFTLWPSHEDKAPANIRIWDARVDSDGRLNVLGVVLGKSTLKEAEAALQSLSERALFVETKNGEPTREPQTHESIEAFFPTSPDRAKLIAELAAPDDLIKRIRDRAYKPMAFPSGSVKLEIAPEDTALVESLVVRSITYIPPISLDATQVEHHFGKAVQQIRDKDGNLHLLYPALGLDAILPKEGTPLLQFVSPQEFDRVLRLLPKAVAEQ